MPILRNISFVAAAVFLTACAATETAQGINDPFETQNRARHEFNKSIDQALLRPVAKGYGSGVPQPVKVGIGNVARNLGTPADVVNDLLQGQIEDAFVNSIRFGLNSTFGLAGLIDVASDFKLHPRKTDFGETLHVWGAPEGAYLELPILGPSTQRDAVGKVVDLFTNPLNYVIPSPERYAVPLSGAIARVGERDEYGDLVDSILYESADSYAQSRLIYLDNRRFSLNGTGGNSDDVDPYEDLDGIDPYAE